MTKTELYRHFDQDDTLLYVGISANAAMRLADHMRNSPWQREIAKVTIARYPDRGLAQKAERAAILAERPLWNKVYNAQVREMRLGRPVHGATDDLPGMVASGLIARIGPSPFAVYCVLHTYADKASGTVDISLPSLCEIAGISRSQVKRDLRALRMAGLLSVERVGRANRYVLANPLLSD